MAVVEAVQGGLFSVSQVAPCYFQSPESGNAIPSQGEVPKSKIMSKGFFFFNFKLVFNFFLSLSYLYTMYSCNISPPCPPLVLLPFLLASLPFASQQAPSNVYVFGVGMHMSMLCKWSQPVCP